MVYTKINSDRIQHFNWTHAKYYFGVICFIILVMWFWGYISLLRSSEYAFATNYLKTNQVVNLALGEFISIRPGFYNFDRSYSAEKWTSKFSIVVDGSRSGGIVFLKMESSDDIWKVTEATLKTNNELLDLTAPIK